MAGKFEIKKGSSGKYCFNLKAGNGQIVLSSESCETKKMVYICGALCGTTRMLKNN